MTLQQQIDDLMGNDGILEYGLVIFSYLNSEGKDRIGYLVIEDPNMQQTLGMIEMVKGSLINGISLG